MFYDIFKDLCNKNAETPHAVCLKLGFSQAAASYWKKSGKLPKREHLEKIAEYFNVSVDYLLGREQKTAVTKSRGGIRPDEIIAVKGTAAQWLELLNGMTDEQLLELKDYAEYLIAKGGK